MNLKLFLPVLLLLSLATELFAQPMVPTRPRPLQPAQPVAATNSPIIAPAPLTGPAAPGTVPALPATPPAAGASPVVATPAGKNNEVADISYDFPGLPVEQLLEVYAELVGRTLMHATVGAAALPGKDTTITLKTQSPLTRTEAIEALETILGMNGITIVPIGDKFAKVVTEGAAGGEGGLINTNINNLPEAGKMVTQVVQVKYTALQDLVEVLQPFSKMQKAIIALPSTQTLILRDYAENVDRMVEMVKKIDVLTPLVIKPRVIKIKYALASDISQALSSLGASGGGSVGKNSSGASFGKGTGTAMTGSANGFSGAGGAGGIGGAGGSYPGQATSTSALGSAATSGRSSFQNNLNNIVKNAASAGQFQLFGQTKIIADERTNSLLVFANDEDMKMILDIIDKLDVVLQQVLIDAIIMEVDLGTSMNTEVSYLAQRQGGSTFTGAGGLQNLQNAQSFLTGSTSSSNGVSSVAGSTLASLPSGFSYFAKFGDDLNVVMEAAASDSRSIILSRPRIQTSHAVPADMFIGKTVPYITGSYNYGYSTGPSSQYSQLEVGIHLQILPLINPDGLVVMDIQVDVEGITGYTPINGSQVPITSKQQAGAKVAVLDGQTIMLGGFIQDNPSTTDAGIPGLMNIPWLGNLFKGKQTSTSRQELIMLLRPTVLADAQVAAKVAIREQNRLPGIRQGEQQLHNEEEDRNKAIELQLLKDAQQRAKKAKKDAEKEDKENAKLRSMGITNAPALDAAPPY